MLTIPSSTSHRDALYEKFASKIEVNPELARKLVSVQNDKSTPFYRWFKYKEGFTSQLVSYLLKNVHPSQGTLLDPFAGSGAALFSAQNHGWKAQGIELLPVGVFIMEARTAASIVNTNLFVSTVEILKNLEYQDFYDEEYNFKHIAITNGAFPVETEKELIGYISYCNKNIQDGSVKTLALFASFSILESISYTRKDGQYLRWDARSGRSAGKIPFNKGKILTFKEAIQKKLHEMVHDLQFGVLHESLLENQPQVIQASCLTTLPTFSDKTFDVILTSPPYCNRYDYTRTYALELVYLGCSHKDVAHLRQTMLSCTVENKTKRQSMEDLYTGLGRKDVFNQVDSVFSSLSALNEVLDILDALAGGGKLNNPHIARMVRNYFYEMCFVIFEMSRILVPNGNVIMVNDNVRYAGEEVPVDLILSSMAESFGLELTKIWTLGRGKGNSSQQMGLHGRSELRKCVYIWTKPSKERRAI